MRKLLDGNSKNPPRIYLNPRMSHAKVVMTDGVIAKEITLFVHGPKYDPFISKLRDQLEKDISRCERVLKPFELSLSERILALAGKYTW